MSMNFTDSVRDSLEAAFKAAATASHTEVTEKHLLCSLLKDEGDYFSLLLKNLGLPIASFKKSAEDELLRLPRYEGASDAPKVSSSMQKLLMNAEKKMEELKDSYISQDHLLLAFFDAPTPALKEAFTKGKITLGAIKSAIQKIRGDRKIDSPSKENSFQAIEKYCINLTKKAKAGKLDPVIGRDEEIRRAIQVLSRRTKNNPMLIGEPGVGKTAIAEGLSHRIIQGDVPDSLRNKELVSLDLGALVAGTKFRGEFEERLKSLLEDIESSEGDIILFIDEVHTLIGAGSAEGSMDAANLLKPALARGHLHCIGATTLAEYQKYIEKDAALERRFQPVFVKEPSKEDTISILRGLKERYEIFHGVKIQESALSAAAILSDRYITDRKLPDKAIDLIDEAASLIRMQLGSLPLPIDQKERELSKLMVKHEAEKKEGLSGKEAERTVEEIEKKKEELKTLKARWEEEKKLIHDLKEQKNALENLRFQEEEAERASDYNKVAILRYDQIPKKEKEIQEKEEELFHKKDRILQESVDESLIAEIVAKWTGIPVDKMLEKESQKLLHLEEALEMRVIGQKRAIHSISDAIRRSRTQLADPNRPVGTFLFLGPTGVGKTELVKALSSILFDKEDAIIRLDMSEYMEKHSVSKLIGSPPGYVGYDEGGQLTEQLRRRPYSIVLLDEIEKAHPDVFNMLLQIFDDGRITDSKGRRVNCKNALFIMTSNIGSQEILSSLEKNKEQDVMKVIEPSLRAHFRPEFLNRLDEILPFSSLQLEDMERITKLRLKEVEKRLQERNISLEIDPELIRALAKKGYDPIFGARPLKRLIQSKVVNPLSKAILEGKLEDSSHLKLFPGKDEDLEVDFSTIKS